MHFKWNYLNKKKMYLTFKKNEIHLNKLMNFFLKYELNK